MRRFTLGLSAFRSQVVAILVLVSLAAASPVSADVEGFRFLLPDLDAKRGDALTITVEGAYEQSAQGFVMAARYPADQIEIVRVHAERTMLEALNVDFFDVTVSPNDGILVVSALIDTRPPFNGDLIPNLGFPLALFHIEVRVRDNASGELRIELTDGLSTPPVSNLFTVDNETVRVTELTAGTIRVLDGTPVGVGVRFLRGDVNASRRSDIADVVMILDFVFKGVGTITCMQAADINDDETIDVSDPIRLLDHLFRGGPAPAPPNVEPGSDPTPGPLTCDTAP